MMLSDIISLIAVLIALFSLLQTILSWNNQKKYIKTQDELNKILLQKEQTESLSINQAEMSACVVRMGKAISRIRIFNKGKGRATNVKVNFPEPTNWRIYDEIFPLEYLEAGQSADLKLALHTQSQSKAKIQISWEDADGQKENEVILTL
jgi:uncharacterized membrane protein